MMRASIAALLLVFVPAALATAQGKSAAADVRSAPDTTVSRVDLSGTVYDSVADAPLARAVVQVTPDVPPGEQGHQPVYTATTDVGGRYHLIGIPAGRYLATFFHPALDALGLAPVTRRIALSPGGPEGLDFAVPSPRTLWTFTCQPADATDSTGLLLGHVRDAETGAPMPGAQVTVRWAALLFDAASGLRKEPREARTQADDTGLYGICGVPGDGSIEAQATAGAATSGSVVLDVPPHGVYQADLTISDANTRVVLQTDSAGLDSGMVLLLGTARLAGTVRSPTGLPMSDVELRVSGTGVQGRTGRDGTFVLAGLPAGTYTLETRRIGLAPVRVTVNLVSGRTTHTTVTVPEAVVLSRLTVYGKAQNHLLLDRLAGFLYRKRISTGHFLTRADIERRQAFETTDLLSGMSGVKIRNGEILVHNLKTFWGPANVVVDGVLVQRCGQSGSIVPEGNGPSGIPGPSGMPLGSAGSTLNDYVIPGDIAAVEVYYDAMFVPAQFVYKGCGTVVIWSRYAFPDERADQ